MKFLKEVYSGVHGLDNYDRAIDMINAAVDHHDRNDSFDSIADIDSLVQFLKGQYHDFTPALENTVRQIIADEMGHDELDFGEEEEEFRGSGKYHRAPQGPEFRGPGKYRDKNKRYNHMQQHQDALKNAQTEEEEKEWRAHMHDMAQKRLSTKTSKRTRDDFYHPDPDKRYHDALVKVGKSEDEEQVDNWKTDWNKEVENFRGRRKRYEPESARGENRLQHRRRVASSRTPYNTEFEEVISLSDRRSRGDRFRSDIRGPRRRGHRHSDPARRQAQLMARKVRPYVGAEEEEFDWNLSDAGKERLRNRDTDWNKEVRDFRKRRKTVEPRFAHGRNRLIGHKRRSDPSAASAFSMRFEGFKQYSDVLEGMYRDSQHGLTIDLSGPDGNAFALLGLAQSLAKQLDYNPKAIVEEMKEGDYNHLVKTFEKHFGSIVNLVNKPGKENDDWDE